MYQREVVVEICRIPIAARFSAEILRNQSMDRNRLYIRYCELSMLFMQTKRASRALTRSRSNLHMQIALRQFLSKKATEEMEKSKRRYT